MMLRRAFLPWMIAAAALFLALWSVFHRSAGDPLTASLAAFEKQNRLTVFSARLSPVVASDSESMFGMLRARQIAVIPARVDYTLDLGRVTRDRLNWDAAAHRLDVRLPPLVLSEPDLDEGHALYLREGLWISRTTQDKLTRENTLSAERQAGAAAAEPLLMDLARSAAKEALRQNLAIPLQVAGYGDVTVSVRFDGEKDAP